MIGVLLLDVAVGKTPGEPAGSPVRVGSENGHLVRRTQAVRREGVVHDGSEVHLRERAARFLERLFPTASDECESGAAGFVWRLHRRAARRFGRGSAGHVGCASSNRGAVRVAGGGEPLDPVQRLEAG
jgi:hypothetical protein